MKCQRSEQKIFFVYIFWFIFWPLDPDPQMFPPCIRSLTVSGSALITFLYQDPYFSPSCMRIRIFLTFLYPDPYFLPPCSWIRTLSSLYLDQYFFTSMYPDRTIWALWTRIALKYLSFFHPVKSPNVHKFNMCYKHRSVNYLQWSVRESSFNNFFLVFSRFYL